MAGAQGCFIANDNIEKRNQSRQAKEERWNRGV